MENTASNKLLYLMRSETIVEGYQRETDEDSGAV
jgi:hypothetical protein